MGNGVVWRDSSCLCSLVAGVLSGMEEHQERVEAEWDNGGLGVALV